MKLDYGIASWGLRETPLEEQLKMVKRLGLDLLELGIHGHENDYLQLSPSNEQIEKVKALFEKYGVRLVAASTGGDFTQENPADCYKCLEDDFDVLNTCSKLGIKYLRVFAGFSPLNDVVGNSRYDIMMDCLNKVAEYGKKVGVTPVIETHGGVNAYEGGVKHFLSTSTDLKTFKEMLNNLPDSIAVNFDPANLDAVGIKDIPAFYNKIKDRVKYLHLKDFYLQSNGLLKPTYMGNGGVDWKGVYASLRDYEGVAFFEYEVPEDVEEGVVKCYNFAKKLG